jgi:signal transduction histidine kinase
VRLAGVRNRLGAWFVAAARLVEAVGAAAAAVVLLFALLAGLLLVPLFGVGVPVVAGALGATRTLADRQRTTAGRVLGTTLPGWYTSQPGWDWQDLLGCLRDQQNGRDAVWLGAHAFFGFVVAVLGYGVLAALLGLLAGGTGPFALFTLPVLFLLALLWWIVPWAVRGFALLARLLLAPTDAALARRVEQLTESRAATVDAQAAELRRIERDLHDGAQARLAAVGMTLGLAAQFVRSDPDRATALLEEARADAGRALGELRDLVRGIHPPVLADRGLPGGLAAAGLLCPVPVAVSVELPGRAQAPVESAVYFATAEVLANVGRHAQATRAWLRATYAGGVLTVVVGDDGRGGADPRRGTGLRGIERRLAAFDGALRVLSPPGGPTEITMELPCVLSAPSSPRTTSSSATG